MDKKNAVLLEVPRFSFQYGVLFKSPFFSLPPFEPFEHVYLFQRRCYFVETIR